MEEIERMRMNGIRLGLQGCTFDEDTGKNPKQMEMAKRYVTMWESMKQKKVGLLFWGNTGNGKTFTAACVANALIDQGIPSMVTSFPKILEVAQGMYPEDRGNYFQSMNVYDLLVLDDLGVERQTEYGMEVVYNVIDQRYVLGKPVIITTNLTLDEIKAPKDMRLQRIYDRITAMCIPVKFSGESLREDQGKQMREEARGILYGGA
jgi:DNA replication protein DnaC